MRSLPSSALERLRHAALPLVAGLCLAAPLGNASAEAFDPIPVAGKLATKEGATAPAEGCIVFDGPKGDGRHGSKGILLKTNPTLVRTGSTWKFRYTHGGTAYGIHIIHPMARGQVIVGLSSDSIGLTAPESWREVGFGMGDTKRVNKTPAYKKIFPLQDGQQYEVTSRLSAGGAFELFVNGQHVAHGHVAGARPLVLTIPPDKTFPLAGRPPLEFKGPDLPLEWSPGWTGLILGPMDAGINRCEDLRFIPGLAPAESSAH